MVPTNREELIEVMAQRDKNRPLKARLWDASDILNRIEAAGCVVVPKEATRKMVAAGAGEMDPCWGYGDASIADVWAMAAHRSMTAAAPFTKGD